MSTYSSAPNISGRLQTTRTAAAAAGVLDSQGDRLREHTDREEPEQQPGHGAWRRDGVEFIVGGPELVWGKVNLNMRAGVGARDGGAMTLQERAIRAPSYYWRTGAQSWPLLL